MSNQWSPPAAPTAWTKPPHGTPRSAISATPQEVGRALWREWASSGQLESEGAPVPKRDLVRGYLPRLLWSLGITLLIYFAITVWGTGPYFGVLFALPLFGLLIWVAIRHQRGGGKWTLSIVLPFCFATLVIVIGAAYFIGAQSLRATPLVHLAEQGNPFFLCGFSLWQFFFYKRNLPKRLWRLNSYARRHKDSPVAAEQEYRFTYHLTFGIGIVSSGLGALLASFQLFGLAPTLFLAAAIVVAGLGLEIWRKK